MSTPNTPANPVITSETPTVKSGVSNAIRLVIAMIVAIAIAIFMLLWDGGYMPHKNL
jgi:hypothetical protein